MNKATVIYDTKFGNTEKIAKRNLSNLLTIALFREDFIESSLEQDRKGKICL